MWKNVGTSTIELFIVLGLTIDFLGIEFLGWPFLGLGTVLLKVNFSMANLITFMKTKEGNAVVPSVHAVHSAAMGATPVLVSLVVSLITLLMVPTLKKVEKTLTPTRTG